AELSFSTPTTRTATMQPGSRANKAASIRRLHDRTRILVLPNAWDVASARMLEEEGCAAIGTTSAGVAGSLGYPDGERISRDEMVEAVGRMARAVSVPVTADIVCRLLLEKKTVA